MMRFWRQTIWFIQGFIFKYKKIMILSAVLTILAVVFLLVVLPKIPQPKEIVYVGVVGKHTPAQVPKEIEKELGPGLIVIGEDQRPQPGVAQKWEIEDEGRLYRLFLKENLEWSNGEGLKLADLTLNIPQVGIKMIEPNIIEFRLPEPFAPFLSVLTKPLIKEGVYSLTEFSVKDVKTSGPFLSQVVLDSEKRRFVYRFYDSTSQAILAFKLGQIDRLSDLGEETEIANWPNVNVTKRVANDQYVGIFYNNKDPFLADKSIRQALSYAIEDKEMGNQRTKSTINPKSWVFSAVVKDYEFDVKRARELLSKAMPKDKPVSIELTSTPEMIRVAEKIKEDWQELGLTVETRVTAARPSSFQVLIERVTIPDDPDQYSLWHSTQSTNFTGYESKKVDKLLEDGRQITDEEQRKLIYWDFQRFLAEDVPVTVLYSPILFQLERKR